MQAFPGPEPMSVLLVGGACLLLQGITAQPTDSVDVIIVEMLGSPERTLVLHFPVADKIRRIVRAIGRRHGLKGHEPTHQMRGLAGRPRANLQALDMSRLRLEREPTLPTKLGTRGCETSPLLYGTALNRRSGLSQCVVRQTVG